MQAVRDDMEKVDLYLSLGSNQGDRRHNIETALSLLNIELKKPYKAVSSLIETEPWGFESDEKFINAAVLYELEMKKGYNPEAEGLMILEICKSVERRLGRSVISAERAIDHTNPSDSLPLNQPGEFGDGENLL